MNNVRVAYVENVEGDGQCGHCNRTNLKYVATMSDGSKVGLSCAKKLIGVTLTPKEVQWTAHYEIEATFVEKNGTTYVLWVNKLNGMTRTTEDGRCIGVGNQRANWKRWGYL